MSDPSPHPMRSVSSRDRGMTLVELVVSITVLGLITAVLSSAIAVTLRQQDNSFGRLNVAREEQQIGLWVPADLASASTVDTSPWLTPCGETICDGIDLTGGSNVMLLEWSIENADGTTTVTRVSYHFAPAPEPAGGYVLSRVECSSTDGGPWSCSTRVVLSDLPGPPGGETFVPGVANGTACSQDVDPVPCTRPTWVIKVSEPLAADAIDETKIASEAERKDANRVIVSINGGGDASGAGGGFNQVSITAGGTVRTSIDAKSSNGTPSFVEARSRCGGPVTLVVDESNSIGSAITQVKEGVREFISALAGTPVKLQVVRFQTTSSILASDEWHRYFDMTDQADVDALLAAVDDLRGSWSGGSLGGTNWEEALFRTFYEPDGSTAAILPNTMVFFTDGVPTFDRLVHKTDPGILPAQPPAPGLPWPASTGSRYSQVAFNRADFIANSFRRNVRFVGVGVGAGITASSDWIVDPGAGYTDVVERGSYSHVRQGPGYEARYQVKDSKKGPWYWVDEPTYDDAKKDRRQDVGWTRVTAAEFAAIVNTTTADDLPNGNDGRRTVTIQQPVTTAEFEANAGNPAYSTVVKTWAAGPDWEVWTGAQTGSSDQYRTSRVYNQPPYTGYLSAVTQPTTNSKILARLIAGNDFGTPAVFSDGQYTNKAIADMYVLPQWTEFPEAMKSVALGDCGGTLTLQTRMNGTSAAPDPFRYQANAIADPDGNPVPFEPSVVVTNQQFVTGTFDFPVASGQFVTVDIVPQNYAELKSYTPGAWTCRAGNVDRPFELIDLPDTGAWKGIRVRIGANEAVSCRLSVTG